MHPSFRLRRVIGVVIAVLALVSGAVATAGPAAASNPPSITSLDPQVAPTAGGTPVRIYGSGFTGATAVTFGTVAATDFVVIGDGLITAIVPPAAGGAAADNTFVDVTVTTPAGSNTMTNGMYYTNATITVTPNTGLHPGDAITVVVSGYAPNTSVAIPEIQPLLYYLEGGPPFPNGPPPYVQILDFTSTDASGNLTAHETVPNPFTGTNGQAYDPNIVCPPNQTTTNYLGNSASASLYQPSYSAKCRIEVAQFGTASLGTSISYAGAPIPAAPTLAVASAA
ncbi:MAG: IPT/TIG domain-containing protein, partial [Actinomycetota bacterium]|nr:IPT/TIG domain-containing protein [Actinomycetota bacterium]